MSKKYEFSVVTPFHNTDPDLFRLAVASMRAQTCGFENIEWVLVMHNCSPVYLETVHALLDPDENVKILELNNDNHTASSPRNYGMQFATGRYIGFLDADDSFLPDYAEVVVEAIRRNKAEIAVFRREFEKEEQGLSTVTELVLWDQTQREILLQDEEISDPRLFTVTWGLVTSKVYDLEFLKRHNIRFDEGIALGEDYLFCIETYAKAHRVLVMPQFIGYHYVIHGTSIVQQGGTPGETLLNYAAGFAKILRRGIEEGFPMNATINHLLGGTLSRKIMSGSNVTMEQRIEIRNMLQPFLELSHPIEPNKIFPLKRATDLYEISHSVILHPEQWDNDGGGEQILSADPEKTENSSVSLLQQILERNAETDFGRRYGFANLWTVSAYQNKVPMTDSKTYAPWIRLQTRTGESGIFSADPILTYYTDTGTDGRPMLFPCTESAMRQFEEQMEQVLKGRTTFLNMECMPGGASYNDQSASDSLCTMFLKQYFSQVYPRLRGTNTHLTTPQALFFPPKGTDTRYARLLFALKNREMDLIWSMSAWDLLDLFSYMERVWPTLCKDTEEGRISLESGLPAEFCAELKPYLQPDPERAEEIRRILSQGFKAPVVPQLWPKLARIIACGSGDYAVYGDHLPFYTGDIPHRNGALIVCGGILGIATRGENEYRLNQNFCFCEFRHGKDAPVLADRVLAGQTYEPVITTFSGLYRFRTGTVIFITRIENGQIYFRPLARLCEGLNLPDGTMLHAHYFYEPLRALERQYGVCLTDYAFWGDEHGITVMPEVSGHAGETDKALAIDTGRMAEQLKEAMESGRELSVPQVTLVFGRPGSHKALQQMQAEKLRISPDQILPTRFVSDPEEQRFLMSRRL